MSAVQIQDLNPMDSTINIGGIDRVMRKFDLLARSWAHREFATDEQPNGLYVLSDLLKDLDSNFDPLLKCCYHLLKDKKVFGSFDGFCRAVIEEGDKRKSQTEILGELLKALTYTLGVSDISEDDVREDVDLKKH